MSVMGLASAARTNANAMAKHGTRLRIVLPFVVLQATASTSNMVR